MFPDCYPELNETQRLVRDTIRKVVERELKPHVPAMESGEVLPYPYIKKLVAALGMGGQGELTEAMAAAAPEDELEHFLPAAVAIEVSRVDGGVLVSWGVSFGQVGMTIAKYGTPEQQAKYGPGLQDGSIIGSWCLTEPGAGSDAFGSMQTRARRDGDEYVLNGSKTFITNAPYADVFVVYAKLSENGSGKDIQPFLVERGTPGLHTSKPFKKMGTHSSPTGAVYLDDVRIPKQNLLGGGVRERDHVKSRLGDERAGMPTLSLGLADRAFELALRYAMERKQFGKPIVEFQLVQRRLARMYGCSPTCGASCSATSSPARRCRARRPTFARASFTAARRPRRSPTTRSTSSAATATCRSTRSSGWRATRSSWSSAAAPRRSRS
jgi:alkylation response protein AidB-like acyl-CoA dehydrogenase